MYLRSALWVIAAAVAVTGLSGCAAPEKRPAADALIFPEVEKLVDAARYAEAEQAFRRLLDRELAAKRPDPLRKIDAMRGLGGAIDAQGRQAEAEPILREALRLSLSELGPNHIETAKLHRWMGALTSGERAEESEASYRRALTIYEARFGKLHPETLSVRAEVGGSVMEQAKFAEAEALFRQVLADFARVENAKSTDIAPIENNLAFLLNSQGKFAEAEPFYRSALNRWLEAYGEKHPLVSSGYNNVASNLGDQGRIREAEPLFRKALEIAIAIFGRRHPQVASKLNNIAAYLQSLGEAERAVEMYREASSIWRETLGPDHPHLAVSDSNIAIFLVERQKFAEAEPFLRNALRIKTKVHGERHPATAAMLIELANWYSSQDKYSDAIPILLKARDAIAATLGTSHSNFARAEEALAIAYNQTEDFVRSEQAAARAAESARQARNLLAGASALDLAKTEGGDRGGLSTYFDTYVSYARSTYSRRLGPTVEIKDKAFRAAQDLLGWSTGKEMAQAAARRSAAAPELARLIREQQDLVAAALKAEAAMIDALGEAGQSDLAASQRAHQEATAKLARVETRLQTEFPRYDRFVRPTATSISDAQQALSDDEALLVAVVANGEAHSFLVTSAGSWWNEDAGLDSLMDAIARLRCDVDIATCPHALVVERRRDIFASASEERAFDFASAHRVYKSIFEPFTEQLKRVRRIYVVTSPELRTLPFSMLVTSAGDVKRRDVATTKWLGDRFAFTDLPAVSMLAIEPDRSRMPASSFVGYGAPVLEGDGSAETLEGASRGAFLSDAAQLKTLTPLPGTRTELEAMHGMFDPGSASIHLGADATESRLRADPKIAETSVLTFATHALLPDPATGIAEPGLVLTPPATAGADDDGYLAASEVTDLSLQAQWVILSACNTASPGGARTHGLSALARAFLYAGAEALMASHWRVSDESTAVLTVETLRSWRSGKSKTRAEALQSAMRAVRTGRREDGSRIPDWHPDWAHPAAWAAFTITANRDR